MSFADLPDINPQQTWIDKRGKTKQIPMKVLCPGLSGTGTSSMLVALWELGYEPYQGWSLFENPPDSVLWQEAMKAKFEGRGQVYTKKEFDSIFYDTDAITDLPGSLFADELIEAYPSAKVVMTTRNVDLWYSSCLEIIASYNKPAALLYLLCAFDRAINLYLPTRLMTLKHSYGNDFAANGKAVYSNHLARVRQKMSDVGRLNENEYLEFNVNDGWEPLCKFLGKEVPKDTEGKPRPFPQVNDRATFGQTFLPYFMVLFQKLLWQAGTVVLAVAAMAGALWLGSPQWAKVFESDESH